MTRVHFSSEDPIALAQDLRRAFGTMGLRTSSAIAEYAGINQSQVYRNLFGQPRRVTRTLRVLHEYAYAIKPRAKPDPASSPELMKALSEIWDGSQHHAELIAAMLRTIHRAKLR